MHKNLRSRLKYKSLVLTVAVTSFLNCALATEIARSQDLNKLISIDVEKKTLKETLDEISKEVHIGIIYSNAKGILKNSVTIHAKDQPVSKVLSDLLSPFTLTYEIIGEQIVVKFDITSSRPPSQEQTEKQSIPIKGKVTDEQGQPLPGATVKVVTDPAISITDKDGNFSFNNAPNSGVLIVSFIGYQTVSIPYSGTDSGLITVRLKPDGNSLNEVQVIGYGTTTKRFNTGSVSTVSSTAIENQPVTNPLSALQGRASGVFVQTQNGLPGGNVKIQIRGQGSLASGTDPLYVIDGVPFLSSPPTTFTNAIGANGTISPFSILNPNDIENLSILKDADATAIYGSRGANGVVLITTKKGKSGQDNFTIDFDQGISKIGRLNQYLNLSQYLQLRRQAFKNDNITPTIQNAPDLMVWDTTKATDWQKYFFGRSAPVTNLQTSLSGGNIGTHYLASLNYHREGTILPGDENYTKGGGYLSIDHQSTNTKFSSLFNVSYNRDDNNTLGSPIINSIGNLPPDFPIYNPDGTFNWTISNPVARLQQKQNSQTSYLNINSTLKYKLFPGFYLKLDLGYNDYSINQVATVPKTSQSSSTALDLAYFSNSNSERYIVEPQLNYSKHYKSGALTALLGATYQYSINKGEAINTSGVSNPDLLGNLGAANTITLNNNSYGQYKYASLFGRVNYVWLQKYLIDINLRRDGSSRFGPNKQYGNFYAFGAGWIFSEENFVKDKFSFLSYGKLRASFGLTGNDQINDYQYLYTYGSGVTYGGISTLSASKLANPSYSWETTKKLEFAGEFGFLKDRILTTIAWYRNRSDNQLISYAVPYITGFSSYQANFPAVIQNSGWEFDLNAQPIKGDKFSWNVAFNLSLPKNKLVSFPDIASSSYANTYVVGQDLSIVRFYQFLGVDPQTGLGMYKDQNNDGKLTYPTDAIIVGKTSPDLFGGFNNTLNWKGFQFDLFVEFVKRKYNGYLPVYGSSATNEPEFLVNRWQNPGDITDIPRATVTSSNLQSLTSARFSDASYIRFKNISLAYNLKSSLLQNWHLKNLKLFINGQNLFVLANRKRTDPEISTSTTGIPPLKTLVAGLKISF